MNYKKGILVYDESSDRMEIYFDDGDDYGGLHCGDCFEVEVDGEWKPTRIEYNDDGWYLVGFPLLYINGLKVRV